MNDPLGRIEALEEEQRQLKAQVKRLEEQQTEPIHLTIDRRVEESPLLQRIYDISGRLQTDVALLKGDMLGVNADIKAIRESQADFRDSMEKRFDAIAAMQKKILDRLPEKGE